MDNVVDFWGRGWRHGHIFAVAGCDSCPKAARPILADTGFTGWRARRPVWVLRGSRLPPIEKPSSNPDRGNTIRINELKLSGSPKAPFVGHSVKQPDRPRLTPRAADSSRQVPSRDKPETRGPRPVRDRFPIAISPAFTASAASAFGMAGRRFRRPHPAPSNNHQTKSGTEIVWESTSWRFQARQGRGFSGVPSNNPLGLSGIRHRPERHICAAAPACVRIFDGDRPGVHGFAQRTGNSGGIPVGGAEPLAQRRIGHLAAFDIPEACMKIDGAYPFRLRSTTGR